MSEATKMRKDGIDRQNIRYDLRGLAQMIRSVVRLQDAKLGFDAGESTHMQRELPIAVAASRTDAPKELACSRMT